MTRPTQNEKASVAKGIFFAGILSTLFIGLGYWLYPFKTFTVGAACAFAGLVSGLSLIMGIARAAQLRHFSQNIDGSVPKPESSLDITRRYISNTTEQLLLFIISAGSLALIAPDIASRLLPVTGVWFLIARLMFWTGYLRHPLKRSVGFAATFHPTVFLFGLAAYHLIAA